MRTCSGYGLRILLIGVATVFLSACGGGESPGGTGPALAPPSGLTYTTPVVAVVGATLSALAPTVSGSASTFVVAPSLPAGLTLNASTGLISGTPTAVSSSTSYVITASNASGNTSFTLSLAVNPAAPTGLSYPTPVTAMVGQPLPSVTPTITGSLGTFSVQPALPAGLNMDAATGVISGTPSAVTAAAIYSITASNAGGTTSFSLALAVNPVAPRNLSYPVPVTAVAGTQLPPVAPSVIGEIAAYSVSPGLPPGLVLNPTTGIIAGVPTLMTSSATYVVTASNISGSTSFAVTLVVNPAAPGALSYAAPTTTVVGQPISSLAPSVAGVVTSFGVTPALPAGISLNPVSGVISGTPGSVRATTAYVITASNVTGSSQFTWTFAVNPPAPTSLSYASPITVMVGDPITPLVPVVSGTVTSYTVTPALPSGLAISGSTGIISGTPSTIVAARNYTVAAANVSGQTTFALHLGTEGVVVDAGGSQTVELGEFVTLDGTASVSSSGGSLIYAWQLTSLPSGSQSALAATSSVRPVFRADRIGTYTVSLVVRDGSWVSHPASVNVTVIPRGIRTVVPPAGSSTGVSVCREITSPGNYLLQSDLQSTSGNSACLYVHDTTDVVIHCNGHQVSDTSDQSSRAIEIVNVQRYTIRGCRIVTQSWFLTNSPDGLITDNQIRQLPGVGGQPTLWILASARTRIEFNQFADVGVHLTYGADAVLSDNRFTMTPGIPSSLVAHVFAEYATGTQVLRSEFDGGWDGVTLSPAYNIAMDDAIVFKDVTGGVVRNNLMENYWDAGFEWVGNLKQARIEANVIANAGYCAICGWYWGGVSDTKFSQNLADRSAALLLAMRIYGLRPVGHDGGAAIMPADGGVYFRDNLLDGNVLRNQRTSTYTGSAAVGSSYIPVFEHMAYTGSVSAISGERVPVDAEFHLTNNRFVRNDFGQAMAGPVFGSPVVAGMIIDGGQNKCLAAGQNYPLTCQ